MKIKLIQLVCLAAALGLFATGCSWDSEKFANGTHHSMTLLFPGSPSIRNDGTLVPNQPAATQVMYVKKSDGTYVPVTTGGQSSGSDLPPAPVFGINSDNSVGSRYHWLYDNTGTPDFDAPCYNTGYQGNSFNSSSFSVGGTWHSVVSTGGENYGCYGNSSSHGWHH